MWCLAGIVLEEKYDKLISRDPKAAAEIVGEVEKRNYLAHSIREIEYAVLQYSDKNYHIITHSSEYSKKARIVFFNKGCIIFLPEGNEEMKDEEIRLILAHELGHLVYNIGKLFNPEILMTIPTTNKEEQYAWEFAYHLIKKKSDEHKTNSNIKKFIYEDSELRASLLSVVGKRVDKELYESIRKSLFIKN